ncbi:acyl carrier protein [Streptomyces sp. 2A115]|uniref:acyl carrier protein n=1 Tax=Streptomyces sp. 2A115 TaxID=3457439 RepID=UPI003FD3F502
MTMAGQFGAEALKEILIANLGVDDDVIESAWDSNPAELGVDSIGILELQAVVKDQFGIVLPETTHELSLSGIVELVAMGLKEKETA